MPGFINHLVLFALLLLCGAAGLPAEEVEVGATGEASQSTEWNGGLYPAGFAIDGNASTFSHTDSTSAGNWWRLRLAAEHEIARVELVMRGDCCGGRLSGATLRLFDDEGDSVYEQLLSDPGAGGLITLEFPPATFARTLRVAFENGATNPGTNNTSLHLGEVRVFAEIDRLPVLASFEADPANLTAGQGSTLRWEVDQATDVEMVGTGPVSATGTLVITPTASRVYTLVASNAYGSRTQSLAVLVDGHLLAPRLTEFMADNAGNVVRSDGSTPDWIEIWNPNPVAIDLAGYRLSDDPREPARFVFPAPTIVSAGGYLVVDASLDQLDGVLATGFRLDQAASSALLFSSPTGELLQSFVYPRQREDVSYGPDHEDNPVHFLVPTPGGPAVTGTVEGFVTDTAFSVDRGFFTSPISVAIATPTPEARIYFTTDGSEPAPDNPAATLYQAPLTISSTTVLRAAAFRDGYLPTDVDTQTYLFPADVPAQARRPAGFPPAWVPNLNGVVREVPALAHFGMDRGILATLPQRDREGAPFSIEDALLSLPTMSLVIDSDVLLDPRDGLHVNARSRGRSWERPASIEFLDPTTGDAVQANCGLRMHGGWNRYPEMLKKSFRLYFRSEYGDSKFSFPLFRDGATDEFDRLILRSGNGKAWASPWRALSGGGNSLERTTYLRDQFVRDLQRAMGNDHVAGRFVHLYLNGHYWGLYNPVERPDEHFASSHFGGADEDYDVLKWIRGTGHRVASGSDESWNELIALVRRGVNNQSDYEIVAALLDLPQFVDYMLLNYFVGNQDWVDNNVYALRDRARNGPYRFYCWDSEESLLGTGRDSTGQRVNDTCTEIHHALRTHPEYRTLFADRAQKHLFHDGALTRGRTEPLFLRRVAEVDRAMVAESARWGNLLRPSDPYDHADWRAEVTNLRNNYLGPRVTTTLGQLRSNGLFPTVVAPRILPQRGGSVAPGSAVTLEATGSPGGTIWFTTDGSDPRLPGGSVAPTATAFTGTTVEEILVPPQDRWHFRDDGADLGTSEVVAGHPAYGAGQWKHPDHDDSTWGEGPAPLGYGEVSGATIATPVAFGSDATRKHLTTYFRKRFQVGNPARFSALRVRLLRDDGAVVYLNGREAARSNFPPGTTTVEYDTTALGVSGTAEGTYHELSIPPALLVEGENVLAVEVHQATANSSDLGFDLELVGDTPAPGGTGITIAGDTLLRTRVRAGTTWSPLEEVLFLVGDRATDLVLSEIMYHPPAHLPGTAEFLEFVNRGETIHELGDLRLSGGITFDFSTAGLERLAPGERIVVVRDPLAFQQVHPGVSIAGSYEGALGNGGDNLSLVQDDGTVLWTVHYGDQAPWPGGTDGGGHSLTLAGGDPTLPDSWRPSTLPGGSPGSSDRINRGDAPLLAYALADLRVSLGPAGTPEFVLTTHLGADEVRVTAEWSRDLQSWSTEGLELVGRNPLSGGLATDHWQLATPTTPPLFFRAVVSER